MSTVQEISPEVGTIAACEALGVSRATVYRRRSPAPVTTQEISRPASHRKLTPEERRAVLEALNSPKFVDMAPAAIHAALLDMGTYLCSARTMYRVLAEEGPVRERRNQLMGVLAWRATQSTQSPWRSLQKPWNWEETRTT